MKVLIVGLGSIARKHILALRSICSDLQIYALRSSESAVSFDGVVDLYTWTAVKKKTFDFAIISNPTSEHKKAIQSLAELNIPLFIEKPLFHRLDIKDTVIDIEKKGIFTYIACNLRFLEALLFTKQYISEHQSRINEVNVYCGSYLPEWRKGIDYKQNYSVIPELGGGVHIDLIHEIDYIYWMFGNPLHTQKVYSKSSSLEIEAYDYANYCLNYNDYNVSIILNYYRRDARRTLDIVCEDETIIVDLLSNKVTIKEQVMFYSDNKIADTYLKQLSYFMQCLKENTKTFNTITDAYNVLKICLENDTQR